MLRSNKQRKIGGSSETTREITRNFKDWLVGFIEGDGTWFIRSNNTLGFELAQKTSDSQVLYEIKKTLGFGKVSHNSVSELSRFVIASNSESYWKVVNLVECGTELRLKKRQTQFNNWLDRLETITGSKIVRQNIITSLERKQPSWEDSWLSGFIDAEGCFRISFDKRVNQYRLFFQVTQDEQEILIKIKELFGLTHKGQIRKDRTTYVLAVTGKKARELIIKYLLKHPLKTKKRIAFQKWEECHGLLEREDVPGVQEKIKRLKESINKSS